MLRLIGHHADDHAATERWQPRVMRLSAATGQGLDAFLAHLDRHRQLERANGAFEARRRRQALNWLWDLVQAGLQANFRCHPAVRDALPGVVADVAGARVAPSAAARVLLGRFAGDGTPDTP